MVKRDQSKMFRLLNKRLKEHKNQRIKILQ